MFGELCYCENVLTFNTTFVIVAHLFCLTKMHFSKYLHLTQKLQASQQISNSPKTVSI